MSEDDDQSEMWLLMKNLGTYTKVVVSQNSVWEISEVSSKPILWKRVDFQPKTVTEFQERKKSEAKKNEKTDYAMLEGKYMYRYQVIAISGEYLCTIILHNVYPSNCIFQKFSCEVFIPWNHLSIIQ